MLYESTRGSIDGVNSAQAIHMGISPDGGLFVPEENVKITMDEIKKMKGFNYKERAFYILKKFIDDYSDEEICDCVEKAYKRQKFETDDIVPLYKINDYIHVMELWHGPTSAFKDVALQILPYLLTKAVQKNKKDVEVVILVATSGDTGKAALEGFKDVEGTKIIVFFPNEGVSEIQKRQMITQEGENVYSIGVNGNFDDAQNGVKKIFTNERLIKEMQKKGLVFSSANSINWGRLVPQIVYYFSAYVDLMNNNEISPGDKINFVVPTGNFGNILAAYYAVTMGLPVKKLICASNQNNVLTYFIRDGEYNRNRDFVKTISPSMDILISSNLERLIYHLSERDSELVNELMDELKNKGQYYIDDDLKNELAKYFWGGYAREDETVKTIKYIYDEYNYLVDTHTAVALDVYDKYVIATGDLTKSVIASTASPFKFNKSVAGAVLGEDKIKGINEFEISEILSNNSNLKIPDGLLNLEKREIKHETICEKDEMENVLRTILFA